MVGQSCHSRMIYGHSVETPGPYYRVYTEKFILQKKYNTDLYFLAIKNKAFRQICMFVVKICFQSKKLWYIFTISL